MANRINTVPAKSLVDGSSNPQAEVEKKVERNADRADNKAAEMQRKYD